jgi:predicted membrane-bound spermidine synthase
VNISKGVNVNADFQLAVIILGFICIGGFTIAVGLFPFLIRRDLWPFKFSFLGAGFAGILVSITYVLFVWSLRNELKVLTNAVPYCVIGAIALIIAISLVATYRILIANGARQLAEQMIKSKNSNEN